MNAKPLMQRIAAALLAAAVACSLAACGGSDSDSGEGGDCHIGLSIINQQDIFFTQMADGAEAAAERLGCELTIANADNDPTQQASDIETLITRGVDGLIVNAIDVEGVVPAVQTARDHGIKVVAIDSDIGQENVDTFVGVDNAEAARKFGQWLTSRTEIEGKRYGVVGARNSFIQVQREDAFREVMDSAGAVFTQAVDGENQNEKAATAAQNLLTSQDDLDYIYTTGTPATFGATASVLDSDSDVAVIGWDLSQTIIEGIDKGVVDAVVQQEVKKEGKLAVQELHNILAGKEPRGQILVPTTIVTKKNVDDYRDIYS